jgi:hypothetical protein
MSAKAQSLPLPKGRSQGFSAGWALGLALLVTLAVVAGMLVFRGEEPIPVDSSRAAPRVEAPSANSPAITGTGPGLVRVAGQPRPAITGTGPGLVTVAGVQGAIMQGVIQSRALNEPAYAAASGSLLETVQQVRALNGETSTAEPVDERGGVHPGFQKDA